jgi:outer membrane protein OmpA-like peptidoglycan-associated protein
MKAFTVSARWLVVAAGVAIASQAAVSQVPPKQSTLNVTVNRKAVHKVIVGSRMSSSFFMQVTDSSGKPVEGLTAKDVAVKKDSENVRVTSVLRLKGAPFVSNRVVLVLDNSVSMRISADLVQQCLKTFLDTLGAGTGVALVLFEEDGQWLKEHPVTLAGKKVNLSVLDFTADKKEILRRATTWFKSRTTRKSYLRDAAMYGMSMFDHVPARMQKSLVIMSDGSDIGSQFSRDQALENYTGDVGLYMIALNPKKEDIRNIKKTQEATRGKWYNVKSAKELAGIYGTVSRDLMGSYLVEYKGRNSVEWHLLNYVFFDRYSSILRPEYGLTPKHSEVLTFDETGFSDQRNQYYNILNIVGARMTMYPKATLMITGCNSDTSDEKGNQGLSQQRAATVRQYLTSAWQINPKRLTVQTRNLPSKPSTSSTEAGQAENRRVELTSTESGILKPVVINKPTDAILTRDSVTEVYSLQLFDFDSKEVSAHNEATLREVAAIYKVVGGGSIRVVGFTDNIGDSTYNTNLSRERAKNVCTVLEKNGVPPIAMIYEGVGPKNPQWDNSSPEGRLFNRTVIVTLTYAKK